MEHREKKKAVLLFRNVCNLDIGFEQGTEEEEEEDVEHAKYDEFRIS